MKHRLLSLLLALAVAAHGAGAIGATPALADLKPVPLEAKAAHVSAQVLSRFHYKAMPLDETLSAKIFDQYLKALDSEKLLFVQEDVDRMSAYRTKLGEGILKEDLSVPFAMFNLYRQRAAERFAYARELLRKGFDFNSNESYQFAREKEPWPKNEAEVRDLWRKRIKNDWLRLKLGGKDDKAIAVLLDKRYEALGRQVTRTRSTDAFQVFMNAYTMAIDPHTNYLGPRASTEFGISMQLSLVGIGAQLTELDGYITIRELIAGGPALASAQLKPGDRIVGVAQGPAGAMTDVLGWRVDDAVELIRGAADSVVRLDILPADAAPDARHKVVSLVRKTISLEARAAKASVQTVVDGKVTRRIGVISLPTFYEDFVGRNKGLKDYRSATRDVGRLLEAMKKEGVEGVLIDLRNNGGGSLGEAIELTGMFIDKGPVVQQRNASGEVAVESDAKAGLAWDGPLAVLINRRSASASEIFAAAIQDYGRGLIIGEPSYGKGTVQTLVNLDELTRSSKAQFGELKMTIAQFFRVNGSTTQLRGVTPDILLPAAADADTVGESSFDNALPWVRIKAVDHAQAGDLKGALPVLQSLHEARVRKDKAFQYLEEDIAESRQLRARNLVSLNEAVRRREQAALEARIKSREAQKEAGKDRAAAKGSPLLDDGLQPGERNLAIELAAEKARENAKDVLLIEAVQILGDAARVQPAGAGLAAQVRPVPQPVPQ